MKILITAADKIDEVRLTVPAFIRALEVARENIKTDGDLHLFVESLQRNEDVVTSEMVTEAESALPPPEDDVGDEQSAAA